MNDILYARYLESCVDRLNQELRVIRCLLPEDDKIVLDNGNGKVVNKSCGGLVAILIEMRETAKLLKAAQADDTDNRYETWRPHATGSDTTKPVTQIIPIGEYRRD